MVMATLTAGTRGSMGEETGLTEDEALIELVKFVTERTMEKAGEQFLELQRRAANLYLCGTTHPEAWQ